MSVQGSYRILVAEDNFINIQVAKYILSSVASHIDFVTNGEEAVEFYKKGEYDFILMDVKMPVLDGLEATQQIREIESKELNKKRIPIIAMTAGSIYEEEKACRDAGMDGFLSKPYNIDDLLCLLKTIEQQ